jgi:RimJ/RimL family protein N-acetyltransferase
MTKKTKHRLPARWGAGRQGKTLETIMIIQESLFEGRRIYLASLDPEKDAEIEARWTHDIEYLRLLGADPARPVSPARIKKRYSELEQAMEDKNDQYYFNIRLRQPEDGGVETGSTYGRLLGFVRLHWISWPHGNAFVSLGIADAQERGKGYGSEALGLILRYAFAELNLFRLSVAIPEYNQAALHVFKAAGFQEEVRQRQALHRYGRRWDILYLGLLQKEWQEQLSLAV